jgi:glutamine synthetase
MIREPLVFAAIADVAGRVRGKAFPADQFARRTETGIGWTPTNVQITCFDAIAPSVYGALGDLVILPDPDARATVDFGDGAPPLDVAFGAVRTIEGAAWECCTRAILAGALERLRRVAGLTLKGAFEHEFQLVGGPAPKGWAYGHAGFAAQAPLLGAIVAGLRAAGVGPDTIMKEYGANQYEVTVAPEVGMRVADAAALTRLVVQEAARRAGERATFTPILDPAGVGNGVHVHLSFLDAEGRPATWDPAGPYGMSAATGSFVAGVLRHLPSLVALTAPTAISYLRLTPHRWSAAFTNLGFRDREASVRICPTSGRTPEAIARSFNFEYRAADAAASPHLALAAIVHAGAQGIEDGLPAPAVTEEDLAALSEAELAARGYARLPTTLEAALDRFEADATVRGWFPGRFPEIYLAHKRAEAALVADLDVPARCAAYADVF